MSGCRLAGSYRYRGKRNGARFESYSADALPHLRLNVVIRLQYFFRPLIGVVGQAHLESIHTG
jgi:hypothetical protein